MKEEVFETCNMDERTNAEKLADKQDYIFHDKDIEGFTFDEHNVKSGTIEILIKSNIEAVLLSRNDVAYLASQFLKFDSLAKVISRLNNNLKEG